MLDDILNGQEKSQVILITDTADCSGRLLLMNTCLKCLQRDCPVTIVCSERQPKFFQNWIPTDLQAGLTCVNGFSTSPNTDLCHDIFSAISKSKKPSVILLDSLSILLLKMNTSSICRFLHKLKTNTNVCQIVALFHRDVHDESVHNILTHQATSVIELHQGSVEDYICHIRHCRPTGKVLKSVESLTLNDKLCIKSIQPFTLKSTAGSMETVTMQADPTSQLTFNLSLTDSEKEARSQVILPYMKERNTADQQTSHTGGRIHYEPDEADDLDEEDPDDDLNI